MDLSRFKMSCLAVCLGEGVIITQKALLPSPAVPLAVQLFFLLYCVSQDSVCCRALRHLSYLAVTL